MYARKNNMRKNCFLSCTVCALQTVHMIKGFELYAQVHRGDGNQEATCNHSVVRINNASQHRLLINCSGRKEAF